jgi:hypothetical protein
VADDLKKRGPADRTRINVHETWEVTWWRGKWQVSESELRQAVAAVGVSVEKVGKYLGKKA